MKELVKEAVSEAIKKTRRSAAPAKSDKEKIVDRVDDAVAALADGNDDDALDILNVLLDDYPDAAPS